MPLYNYKCPTCGHEDEVLCKYEDEVSRPCGCGDYLVRGLSAPARTGFRWGDGKAYFDRGLGCEVRNNSHREQLMKQRGLIDGSDIPKHKYDDYIHSRSVPEKPSTGTAIATDADRRRGAELIKQAQQARSKP